MKRSLSSLILLAFAAAVLLSGCAYYNTFYNVKKKFREAEREQRERERQAPQTPAVPPQPGNPGEPGQPEFAGGQQAPRTQVPASEKYRKILETSSKLLEYYPKSRWVDDALLVMGISYYRLGDLVRAERKFTELMTLFPNSKHLADAAIWKARVLSEQKKGDEARALLQEHLASVKSGPRRAAMLFLMGRLAYDAGEYSDAAEQFQAAAELKQDRSDYMNARFHYAMAQYVQGRYEPARDAFAAVARHSGDLRQAYDAHLHWARSELALNNAERAESILDRLKRADKFAAFSADTDLELARVAVQMGHVEEGIGRYQRFITDQPPGERRGLAYYQLALIQRDLLLDLPQAKALLDSVPRAGASKAVADSAKAAVEQISKGLLALERIRSLRENLAELDTTAVADSSLIAANASPEPPTDLPPESVVHSPSAADTNGQAAVPAAHDSLSPLPELVENLSARSGREAPDPMAGASGTVAGDTAGQLADDGGVLSPARQAADSLVRLLARSDSATVDSVPEVVAPEPALQPKIDTLAAAPRDTALTAAQARHERRQALRRELQAAYLHVAEFYEYSLADEDSSMYYYRLAASDRAVNEIYWRANLFIAHALTPDSGALPEEAVQRYQAVLNADSVPVAAQNLARRALGQPLIDMPEPPQAHVLRQAESAFLSGAPADSLLGLYTQVAVADSSTDEARMALFAKAMILEDSLHRVDAARVVYESLLTLEPDSAQAAWIRAKLAAPDSNSVFNMSDEELAGVRPAVESILEAEPDANGWPPPEESLRGRRYR